MRRSAIALWVAGAMAVAVPTLHAEAPRQSATTAVSCALPMVRISAAQPRDAADACVGASAAIDFLASHGTATSEPIEIAVVERLPAVAGTTAAGCFIASERRVYLLTYEGFRTNRTWFGMPIDRHLYRSLAAHEVAHALASCGRPGGRRTIQATEYVAYVTMFATMHDGRRARALANLPGQGFSDASRITPVFYMFDPARFGAEAYRHYLRPTNGAGFLRAVLAGEALAE